MGLSEWLKGTHPSKKVLLAVGGSAVLCGAIYGVYKLWYSEIEQEIEESVEEKANEKRILILGLDGSGKSTFLSALSQQGLEKAKRQDVRPTEGFSVICVTTNGLALNIWEIGGGEKFRSYWHNFTNETDVLIYTVDSSDEKRFHEAKEVLTDILEDENLKGVPLIILATKMDLPESCSLEQIMGKLEISKFAEQRKVRILGIQVPPVAPEKGIGRAQDVLMEMCGNS